MEVYIPLMAHVFVAAIGLLFGLYMGILLRGILKSIRFGKRKEKRNPKNRKKPSKDNKDIPNEPVKEPVFAKEKKEDSKKTVIHKEKKKKFKPDFSSEKPKMKHRSLKSCLYDKTDSWTDLNCAMDGEENDTVIEEHRKGQSHAYNILNRKKTTLIGRELS